MSALLEPIRSLGMRALVDDTVMDGHGRRATPGGLAAAHPRVGRWLMMPRSRFMRRNPRGVLATYRRDGQAQLSPVMAAVDAEDAGRDQHPRGRGQDAQPPAQPRAAFCALSERFFGAWFSMEGDVEIVSLPDAMEPLVDYYRRVSGEHPDWQEYREAMARERACSCASPSTAADRRYRARGGADPRPCPAVRPRRRGSTSRGVQLEEIDADPCRARER